MKKEGRKNLKEILDKINKSVSELYHIATHDEKTGIHNHVFFKEIFCFELEKARRGRPLSLIVIDIDFFKKINDTHGHLQADKILLRLARLLEKVVREYDVVARFGGEEFFVMLPNAKIDKAKNISERIRRAVLKDVYLSKYKVSISGGVAEYKEKDNFERIAKRADKALYKAKEGGRNRICVGE